MSKTHQKPYIVIYDGECQVCRVWIQRLTVLDKQHLTQAIPLQTGDLHALHPRLTQADALEELKVVTPKEELYGGWKAVCIIAKLFPQTWLIGAVGSLPLFSTIGNIAYKRYAANRHCKI